ncbi:peptidylprolyl isomerase [Nocardioides dongkuii]|uniref:peptidylprolyl isomerase n=1 Tax=Nocardioides dongkuii TaxID=2760089 RepID=UPI0015F83122|nr:peptidylprolyl isomerase [Nocardioides dongkuii]
MPSAKRSLAVLAALASVSLLAGCGEESDSPTSTASESDAVSTPSGSTSPTEDAAEGTGVACEYIEDAVSEPAKEVDLPPGDATVSGEVPVTIETSIGDLSATLDAEKAPCTVNSFVSLAEQQYYDDTTCHRVTTAAEFGVLQCGDPTGTGMGGPGYQFGDELTGDEVYTAGTIAMANAGPDTNGSQFFLVYADTRLDPAYTVFGTLDEASVKLVADAAAAGTQEGGPDGTPKTAVDISAVTVG